jgi:glycosyltransferase involved in cell wall biosynthesis
MVGRLVSDKGADLLLQALHLLKPDQLYPSLTIVGDGPERPRLEELCTRLRLGKQVHFAGEQVGPALVQLLNQHRLLIVPSRWQEPFGLVALEGIACGCVVIGSSGGGLSEAIGPCGLTFPNNQVVGLVSILRDLLRNPAKLERYRSQAALHLQSHSRRIVAQRYLSEMNTVTGAGERV